jgi:hypothetical protein
MSAADLISVKGKRYCCESFSSIAAATDIEKSLATPDKTTIIDAAPEKQKPSRRRVLLRR